MNILQQNKTKKFFISFLIQALFIVPVFGIDLDYTVDDAIRKNYGVGSNGINNAKPAVKPVQKTTPAPAKPKTTESMPKLPALGTGPNPIIQKSSEADGIEFAPDKRGYFTVDEETRETSIPRIYAGGDVAPVGTSNAINAMGAGKKAAKSINEYLATK